MVVEAIVAATPRRSRRLSGLEPEFTKEKVEQSRKRRRLDTPKSTSRTTLRTTPAPRPRAELVLKTPVRPKVKPRVSRKILFTVVVVVLAATMALCRFCSLDRNKESVEQRRPVQNATASTATSALPIGLIKAMRDEARLARHHLENLARHRLERVVY